MDVIVIFFYWLYVKLFGSKQQRAEVAQLFSPRREGADWLAVYRDISSESDMRKVIERHNRIGDRVTEQRELEEKLAELQHQKEMARLQGQVDAAKAHLAGPGTFHIVERQKN